MTDHRALVTAHVERGDYPSAADAHTAHLRENWDRAWQQWLSGHGPHRDKFQQDYAAAQQSLTSWLVAVDKNLRGEVEALVAKWRNEAAA